MVFQGIHSNADLPASLNTEQKQIRKAKQLAESHFSIPAKRAGGPRIQGFFSRTMFVTLKNGKEVVIQFRPQKLDIEPFQTARKALGDVVPDIELLKDEDLERDAIWVYLMTRMPGKIWLDGICGRGPRARVTITKSLGRIFARGYVEGSSDSIIDRTVRPHLEKLLASTDSEIQAFRSVTQDLLAKVDQLKKLPLFISHFDLNEVNILIDDNCEVSGIVDWELSAPLPFGMGFNRIHTLAGEISEGEFYMPDEFEEAERGFWQEVFDGVPEDIRKLLDANLEVIQTSVILGTLLNTFEMQGGDLGQFNNAVLKALPKWLSYRIPFLRGEDPPYTK